MAVLPVFTAKQKRLFNIGAVFGVAAASAFRPVRVFARKGALGILRKTRVTATRNKLGAISRLRGLIKRSGVSGRPTFRRSEVAQFLRGRRAGSRLSTASAGIAFQRGGKAATTKLLKKLRGQGVKLPRGVK